MNLQLTKQEQLVSVAWIGIFKINAEIPILKDAVVQAASSPVVPPHGRRFFVSKRSEVCDLRVGVWQKAQCDVLKLKVVSFQVKSMFSRELHLVHERKEVLHVSHPAQVVFKIVLGRKSHGHVFQVGTASHDLESVIQSGHHLDVFKNSARSHTV